jgi:hypothetical protein
VVYNDGTAEVGTEAKLEDGSKKIATVGQLKVISDLVGSDGDNTTSIISKINTIMEGGDYKNV